MILCMYEDILKVFLAFLEKVSQKSEHLSYELFFEMFVDLLDQFRIRNGLGTERFGTVWTDALGRILWSIKCSPQQMAIYQAYQIIPIIIYSDIAAKLMFRREEVQTCLCTMHSCII